MPVPLTLLLLLLVLFIYWFLPDVAMTFPITLMASIAQAAKLIQNIHLRPSIILPFWLLWVYCRPFIVYSSIVYWRIDPVLFLLVFVTSSSDDIVVCVFIYLVTGRRQFNSYTLHTVLLKNVLVLLLLRWLHSLTLPWKAFRLTLTGIHWWWYYCDYLLCVIYCWCHYSVVVFCYWLSIVIDDGNDYYSVVMV